MLFGNSAMAQDKPETVLYLFAHQDDEIGPAAKMAADVRAGRNVYAVWITDGSGTAEPAVREKESRAAMDFIGVPQENLYFLGYRDRDSWKHLDAEFADILKIATELQPAEITCIAYEGGNIDHDVTSLIASLMPARVESVRAVYEFPLYNSFKGQYRMGEFIPRDDTDTLYTEIDKELYRIKKGMVDKYPSQAAILMALKPLLSKTKLKKKGEPYRVQPEYDYLQSPTVGPVAYEGNKRNPVTFEDDWKPAVAAFLENLKNLEQQ